ncbi:MULTISPECIES: hypothetical protein [Pseudomonas]|uniref:Uncharacterized protein n=2 Tax=Pseudomonas TaxID=286 RepID=A0A120G5I2_PSEFL|nr:MULTISPECIES: hypothetical protein [Pseudomonas]KRC97704.1 hypothetical protein ASE33_03985 [Pseudomonas sp. Root9]KWV84159.1 hypothetical protein PFL603g_00257 [Pseudomonas fluorescens]MDD1947759.1 hypothetical protein [Pseudomonas carnis]
MCEECKKQIAALIAENERLTNSLHEAREDRNKLGDRYDAVNAEVAGLKTGYEAYERVKAELKAENEALRKDAEQWRALVRRAESPVIGYTGCVTCGVYTDHGGLSCPKMRATADAALGQGEQS